MSIEEWDKTYPDISTALASFVTIQFSSELSHLLGYPTALASDLYLMQLLKPSVRLNEERDYTS
jgi:hypothetical protein